MEIEMNGVCKLKTWIKICNVTVVSLQNSTPSPKAHPLFFHDPTITFSSCSFACLLTCELFLDNAYTESTYDFGEFPMTQLKNWNRLINSYGATDVCRNCYHNHDIYWPSKYTCVRFQIFFAMNLTIDFGFPARQKTFRNLIDSFFHQSNCWKWFPGLDYR